MSVSCQTDVDPLATSFSSVESLSLAYFALDMFFVHIFFFASSPLLMSSPCESTDTIIRMLGLSATSTEAQIESGCHSALQRFHSFLTQQKQQFQEAYVPSEVAVLWYCRYKGEQEFRQADGEVLLSAATKALKRLVECGRDFRSRIAALASHVEQRLSRPNSASFSFDLNELLMIPIGTKTREQVKEQYAAVMDAIGAGGAEDVLAKQPYQNSCLPLSFSERLSTVREALKSARKIWDDIEAEGAARKAQQDNEREEARRKHEEQRNQKLNIQWNYVSYITKYKDIMAPASTAASHKTTAPSLSYAEAVDKWSGNVDKLNDNSIQPFVILGLNPSLYRHIAQKEVIRQIGNGKKKLSLFVHPDKCSGSIGGSEDLSAQAAAVYSTMTTACEMCVTLIQNGGYLLKQKGSPSPFADLFCQTASPMSFPEPSASSSASSSSSTQPSTSETSTQGRGEGSDATLSRTSGPSSNSDIRPSGLYVEYVPANKKEPLRVFGSLPAEVVGNGEVRAYILRPTPATEEARSPPPSGYAPPDCFCYVARKEFRPRGKLAAAYLSDGEMSDEDEDLKEYARRKVLRKQYRAALNRNCDYDGAIEFRVKGSLLQPLNKSSKHSYNWYIDDTEVNVAGLYWVGLQVVACQPGTPSGMLVSKIRWSQVVIPSENISQTVYQTLRTFEGAPFVDQELLKPYLMAGSHDTPSKTAMKCEADCLRLAKAWARTTKYSPSYQSGSVK
eukprot:GHVS01069708.1.p1 GENE.GHVS01069708.1~~GHVS01069708.1.p1  ORF type:complete len:790 (+),score=101.57 GHVS01069708.1:178-2370(+)